MTAPTTPSPERQPADAGGEEARRNIQQLAKMQREQAGWANKIGQPGCGARLEASDNAEALAWAVKVLTAPAPQAQPDARAVEALMAAQSFIADGGLAESEPGASIYRQITQALSALSPSSAQGGEDLPPIALDGPHKPDDNRLWLARQLMDSRLTAEEAYSIVAYSPAISDALSASPQPEAGEAVAWPHDDKDWIVDERAVEAADTTTGLGDGTIRASVRAYLDVASVLGLHPFAPPSVQPVEGK